MAGGGFNAPSSPVGFLGGQCKTCEIGERLLRLLLRGAVLKVLMLDLDLIARRRIWFNR